MTNPKAIFTIQIKHAVAIGPGKADLLEKIAATGSLAESGRQLNMSYQRVWNLVNSLNTQFKQPLVTKQRGGSTRGGAEVTEYGLTVLKLYRKVESKAAKAITKDLAELEKLIK